MNERHEGNRRNWNANAASWQAERERDGLWRRCPSEPAVAFEGEALSFIRLFLGEPQGKRACVVGSGDNYVAFALAGMGMSVTSVDIAENQLANASSRAEELGLAIDFVRADACDMRAVYENSCDLVCSSNGFFVWIEDLAGVFSEIQRVLRPGGHYIFYDVHPFQRPWKNQAQPLEMDKDYWSTGPFEEEQYGTTEFNWTLGDLLNPLALAGLRLVRMAESPPTDSRHWEGYSYVPGTDPGLMQWRRNPRAGLPVWLTVAAQKSRHAD
jgi:SAM-dependent methyltransferase